ncbi:hypothetical protein QQ045_009042 [Rhodiola kirilowii]
MVRSAGKDKEVGKTSSVREVSECSWDATLKSFLQLKGKGRVGKEKKKQTGSGLCLLDLGDVGQGSEHALVKYDDLGFRSQAVDASVDFISLDEVFVRRLDSMEGASKRLVS